MEVGFVSDGGMDGVAWEGAMLKDRTARADGVICLRVGWRVWKFFESSLMIGDGRICESRGRMCR